MRNVGSSGSTSRWIAIGGLVRICLYTETALPMMGGQEYVVDALAREYLRLGHDPVVLAPPPRRPLVADDHSFPYPIVRHPRFLSKRYFLAWYRHWLLRMHRRRPLDVVHCHSVFPTGYLASLCRQELNIPLVITSHGGDIADGNHRLAQPRLRTQYLEALALADALIAISPFTERAYRRLHPATRAIARIPNGVQLELYDKAVPRPANLDPAIVPGKYVLFLGRLDIRKGVDTLLRAWAKLPRPHNYTLVVAGGGREGLPLKTLARELQIAGGVRFLGPVTGETKTYLLQNCLCTAIPSRWWEAYPLVVLESFAAGRPVIATRIPGLGRLVSHGRTGWLIAPEASDSLAARLHSLFQQPAMAEELGSRARTVSRDYTWRAVARQHIDLYQSLREPEELEHVGSAASWTRRDEHRSLRKARAVRPTA